MRERWDKHAAFIMAAIGSAIGLGNVWRFPYMAYDNGGGAFFIPYVIALITTGIPLLALEYFLGIRFQKGPTEAYGLLKKHSNFIGWFALSVSAMITIYYAVIMGWAWNYMFSSVGVKWAGISKDFFYNNILGLSDSIAHIGSIKWPIIIGNFLTWVSIFLIIFKGVKIVGKVVNWTVGLPWFLLLILIIPGTTLKGANLGLEFYLRPDFSKLLDPKVWLAAYGQIFFSLSLGFGIMIAYASYLPKKSDINTNAWIVSFANCATSFFAGFAIFSILGYLAVNQGVSVDKVIGSGPGLAFVIYPQAISKLPGGIISQSIFGIAFFFMLLTLGIDSAFSLVEAIVTGLKDSFKVNREKTAFWVSLVGFVLGTIYATRAGLYWLDLVDHWMNWGLIIVGLMEAVLIGWFLDVKKISKDIDSTSAIKFGKIWIFSVKYLTPLILLYTLTANIIVEFQKPYSGYPIWSIMVGGWGILITLFMLAIVLQNRDEFSKIKNIERKTLLLLVLYVVLLIAFYEFYKIPEIAKYIVIAVAVFSSLWVIIFSKNKRGAK